MLVHAGLVRFMVSLVRLFLCLLLCIPSHFETTSSEILDLYARVTGTPLDLDIPAEIPKE